MASFTSQTMNFCLFTCFTIYMFPVVVLNDTNFYSTKLENPTNTNISERKYLFLKGNYSHKRDLDGADDSFVYILNTTKNVLKADHRYPDSRNDSIKDSMKDLDKFDMLSNKSKSSSESQRITTDNQVDFMTSKSPIHSVLDTRTELLSSLNNERDHTLNQDIVTKKISSQKPVAVNLSKEDINKKRMNVINTSMSNTMTSDFESSSTTSKSYDRPQSTNFFNINRKNTQFVLKSDFTKTTTIVMTTDAEKPSKKTVHYLPIGRKHYKHHKTMHHLSLVPIEDGPFGSLIWKDKKYLISVLIPIIIGIVGAACIIGMTYTARYCHKYETKIREIRSTITHQGPSNNDQIVLLTDSSDEL